MANYSPPNNRDIPFEFTTGGYTARGFGDMQFNFGLRPSYEQTADLRATIEVMQLYQDTTYTYLKECPKIVTGFGSGGVQILKLPCVYGGIRDIGGYVYGNPEHADLGGYLRVVAFLSNLPSFIRPTIQAPKELPQFIRPFRTSYRDLISAIRRLDRDQEDISGYVSGWFAIEEPHDLYSYVYGIPPVDLNGILNVIEIRDLPTSIEGVWWHGQSDLPSQIPSTSFRNYTDLIHSIHGWDTLDLQQIIRPFAYYDLNSYLNAGVFGATKDLAGVLEFIAPILLRSEIHGWDTKDLLSYITGGRGPGDLGATVIPTIMPTLKASIYGVLALRVTYDLRAYIDGSYTKDLGGQVSPNLPVDLGGYIDSRGRSLDLGASIIPKTIVMSSVFKVSLLEHIDLRSLINYGCWASRYEELGAYVYPLMKKDLKTYIIGWKNGQAHNIRDLRFYINVDDYKVIDKIPVTFVPFEPRFTQIKVNVTPTAHDYYSVSKFPVVFDTRPYSNLGCYIFGEQHTYDLRSTLMPTIQSSFSTLPEWVKPKTREVFINLERFEERWRRFVNIMFSTEGTSTPEYFYVDGTEEVYKIDRDRHWTIWGIGYTRDDALQDIKLVRRKFIFNLSKYNNMDEAIRFMLTRAAEYAKADLKSVIQSVIPPNVDLGSSITPKVQYTWYKHLKHIIYPINESMFNLTADITGEYFKSTTNLESYITGKSYEPPDGDSVLFNFEDDGYVPDPATDADMDWTYEQAEDFWK